MLDCDESHSYYHSTRHDKEEAKCTVKEISCFYYVRKFIIFHISKENTHTHTHSQKNVEMIHTTHTNIDKNITTRMEVELDLSSYHSLNHDENDVENSANSQSTRERA